MAVQLCYELGYSCEEISTIMNCPVNTVKTRLFHARAKLQKLLPGLGGTAAPPRDRAADCRRDAVSSAKHSSIARGNLVAAAVAGERPPVG